MVRILKALLGLLLLAVGVVAGLRPLGSFPPLGALLAPAGGVWALPRAAAPVGLREVTLPIFDNAVRVVIDDRAVPHIFAVNELDGYRALGYLVARDRLFQLEIQTRAAAGTLTELVGPRALAADRDTRRLGFGRMVERTLAAVDSASPAARAISAYAQGVNAWIDGMSAGDLPLEYRLLGRRPARWTRDNTYFLLARMALTLAYNDASLIKERAAARVGRAAADVLFPLNAPIQEPIQPSAADSTQYHFLPIPAPGPPDSAARASGAAAGLALALGRYARWSGEEALGSNNWAVGPGRSANHHALLAGDPHLELTLPSIWYQAHLVVPGRLDVEGVTLPGAPWIVIGFNRSIAWSLTNTGSDVNDFYRETVDDPAAPARYRLDGEWKPLERRLEVYRSPAGDTLAVDTVRFTHRGPLWKTDSSWLSMAWTIYGARSSGAEFLGINRAGSVREFLAASAGYVAPAQNMLVADREGTIAIRSTGRYPIRPDSARGDWIQDGSRTANDWRGALGLEAYPFAINPARGFLSSANQQPVDPAANPNYLGANWYSPWRAIRINGLLRRDSAVTSDAMRRYQTDPGSARADAFVPMLLAVRAIRDSTGPVAIRAREARALLRTWDRRYGVENTGAVLFEAVMEELARDTWDELGPASTPKSDEVATPRPAEAILLGLLHDSASVWWDDRRTPAVETMTDIVDRALAAGLDSAVSRHGRPGGPGWAWGRAHHANIHHLLRLPALSALDLSVPSGPSTISPSSGKGTHGASWRMVVDLGTEPRAWAVYPGGQSGNPVSPHYRDLLPRWLAGNLDELSFPATPDALPSGRVESRMVFSPKGGAR